MSQPKPQTVLLTGAGGNLGGKLVDALAANAWCTRIVALDKAIRTEDLTPSALSKIVAVPADLTQGNGDWVHHFSGIDACIHLAAQRANVDATWSDAAASFDMTVNVGMAALRHRVPRVVFASSNHVMGGYKDEPLSAGLAPGGLSADLPVAPGTKWHDGTTLQDSTRYATAKLMGERFFTGLAIHSAGALTSVSVRVGWAQPGENAARTISHAGSVIGGMAQAKDEAAKRDLRWFRNMWLSNDDLAALFLAAVTADSQSWPSPGIVVNGVSRNSGSDWDLNGARQWLGYEPQHDLYAELEK